MKPESSPRLPQATKTSRHNTIESLSRLLICLFTVSELLDKSSYDRITNTTSYIKNIGMKRELRGLLDIYIYTIYISMFLYVFSRRVGFYIALYYMIQSFSYMVDLVRYIRNNRHDLLSYVMHDQDIYHIVKYGALICVLLS